MVGRTLGEITHTDAESSIPDTAQFWFDLLEGQYPRHAPFSLLKSLIATATEIVNDLTPQLGGPLDTNDFQIKWSKGADVVSAAELPVLADGNIFDVTGANTITSIAELGIGTLIVLHFDAALTLTHSADLVLPGAANITTAADDEALFYQHATGDWRCLLYSPATGMPIGVTASFAELNIMDGVTATAAEINQAADQSENVLVPGAGITDGASTVHTSGIEKIGDLFKTTLYMAMADLKSSTTDLDIIGVEGADVVVNGDWATDSDWSYGADWSFDTNKADCAAGAGTVMEPAAALTVVAGATYEVTYTMSSFVAGTCVMSIGGTNGTSRGSDATFVERIVAGDTTNLKFTGDAAGDYQIDDVIVKRVSPAFLGQITAAKNGTIFHGEVTFLESPATGADDIDFYSAPEATGKFDEGITGLTQRVLLTKGGAWVGAVQTPIIMTGLPAANEYIYLTCGEAGVPATYSAGKCKMVLWGA